MTKSHELQMQILKEENEKLKEENEALKEVITIDNIQIEQLSKMRDKLRKDVENLKYTNHR